MALAFFSLFPVSVGGDFRFPLTGGDCLEMTGLSLPTRVPCTPDRVGDGSLLRGCDVLVLLGFDTRAFASIPALEAGLGIDWHISVARLTPAERRSDLAFGFGGRDGGGEGCF
jgi:hypothetical protein